MSSELLGRLAQVLSDRGAPAAPILAAVEASGTSTVYVAASGFTRRIDLLVPFTSGSLAAIAPNVSVLSVPPRSMLRMSAAGDQLAAARVVVGKVSVAEAIDDAGPATARDAWRPIVEQLAALGHGEITSRTHVLTDPRGAIAVRYPDRDAAADQAFQDGIATLARRLGVSESQCELWRKLHAANGTGPAVTVASQCLPAGPTPELGFLYRTTQWDQAITLTTLIADAPLARSVAAAFGTLSSMLHSDELSGVEVLLGGEVVDVVAWTTLKGGA